MEKLLNTSKFWRAIVYLWNAIFYGIIFFDFFQEINTKNY